jgi:hypothetical protein
MIKGLGSGLPNIGYAKIGIGTPKDDKKTRGAPIKFDHIELTGRERDRAGRLIPDLDIMRELVEHEAITTCGGCDRSKELGFKDGLPTRIPIRLPYADLELNVSTRMAMYRGGTAFCTGDLETAQRLEVQGEGTAKPRFGAPQPHGPCGPGCPDFEATPTRCKPNTRFQFILGIQKCVGACYEFRTTSWNSTRNLVNSLRWIETETGGFLKGVPLFFEVSRQTVQPKSGGAATTAFVARVSFPGTTDQLVEAALENLKIRAPIMREIRRLEASIERGDWTESEVEAAAIEAEFYPDPDATADAAEVTKRDRDEALVDGEDLARLGDFAEERAKSLCFDTRAEPLTADEVLAEFLRSKDFDDMTLIPKGDLPGLLLELREWKPADRTQKEGDPAQGELPTSAFDGQTG